MSRDLLRSTLPVYSIRVLGALMSLTLHVYLMNAVDPENYGRFVFALSIVAIAAVTSYFGIGNAYIRRLPNIEIGARRYLSRRGSSVVLRNSIVVSTGAFTFLVTAGGLSLLESAIYTTGSVLIALSSNRAQFLRAMDRQVVSFVPECLVRPTINFVSLFVLLALVSRGDTEPVVIALAFLVAVGTAYVIGEVILFMQFRGIEPTEVTTEDLRLGKLYKDFAQTLTTTSLDQVPIVVSRFLFDFGVVGVIGFSYRLLQLVNFGYGALFATAVTRMSRFVAQGETSKARQLGAKSGRILSVYFFGAAACLWAVGPALLSTFLPEYRSAAMYAAVLCGALSATYLFGMNYALILLLRHHFAYIALGVALIVSYSVISYLLVDDIWSFIIASAILLFSPNFFCRWIVWRVQ